MTTHVIYCIDSLEEVNKFWKRKREAHCNDKKGTQTNHALDVWLIKNTHAKVAEESRKSEV